MDERKIVGSLVPGGALLVLAAVAGSFRLRAYDLFWHLASGRWILDHRSIPDADPFRFTSSGAPWVDHGWLFQIFATVTEKIAGLDGLVLVRVVLAVALAALLLIGMRRAGAPTWSAVIVVMAAVLGARPRLMMRPEIATVVAVPILLILLQEMRRVRSTIPAGLAVCLTIVWVNLHAGALIAPVLAAAFLVGCRLPGGSRRSPVNWWSVSLVPPALAVALVVNPAGTEIFRVPFRIGRALGDAPVVNPEWLPIWAAPLPGPIVGALALAALAALAAVRARRLDPATGLATLVVAALAASGVRHQGVFFTGAAFLAGEALADLRGPQQAIPRHRWKGTLAAAACLVAAAWCVWPPPSGPLRPRQGPITFGTGLEPGRFPVHAVDEIEARAELGAVYNDVAFGGYLLWRLFPPRQVFIDGRNEVDPFLLRELSLARSDSRAWTALLRRYGVDGALVRYDDRLRRVVAPPSASGGAPEIEYRTSSALLFPKDRFALVYWDDTAMLFVRRTPERAERLAREEYRFVHPEDRRATVEAASGDPAYLERAKAELRRRLDEDPTCLRALALAQDLAALDSRSD